MRNIELDEVENIMRDIICKRLHIDYNEYDSLDKDKNLLGEEINFTHREILYILFDIEDVYHISIPQNYLLSKDTYTIHSLSHVINELI